MYRSRTELVLGMPHTRSHALSEVALLAHAAHLRWTDFGQLTGTAPSRQRDHLGNPVYASFFYVEISGFPPAGLACFGPDDALEVVSSLGRFGRSVLDGEHRLYRRGFLPVDLPGELPAAPCVRLSNVLVALGTDAADLSIATPANADVDAVPALPTEPDSYQTIRQARATGSFFGIPLDGTRLWPGAFRIDYTIDPDRDLNGVGLLYFCNYVSFMDLAERLALEATSQFQVDDIDRRSTIRRRIGYYGNARARDTLAIEVEGHVAGTVTAPRGMPLGARLILHHRVRRASDDRLIAVSSAEKVLLRPSSS
jgi:probable biosynthetic protein (TIGR04098 family)